MLAKIITKKLNYRIIDYLLNHTGIVTSIAKAINSKKANVSKALRELEQDNILAKDIIGKSHSYRFNYYHPEAAEIIKFIITNRANELNTKLKNLPKFVNAYLKVVLKDRYVGLIVFGSALTGKYKDIDIYLILKKTNDGRQIIENLKSINKKISPIIGTEEELRRGLINHDSLFENIARGIPFGCLSLIFDITYGVFLVFRKDIEEGYLAGYREIQGCKKFKDDKVYVKSHLEKGIFHIIYALLNYKKIAAANDREAEKSFKEVFKYKIPKTLKQAEEFAERMKTVIFY